MVASNDALRISLIISLPFSLSKTRPAFETNCLAGECGCSEDFASISGLSFEGYTIYANTLTASLEAMFQIPTKRFRAFRHFVFTE